MRFNDLLHLIATLAPRLDRGDSLGRRMGNLRHPVSSLQPRCRIPVRFPSPQTNFSPYIPLSAAFARAGSGDLPAQLQVGPCPPTGPGEPRVAGPGLGGWGRTRRRTIHHRPRFDHLRDLRPGQGGCPPPQPAPYLIRGLYRQAGLSPAAGRGRRNRRRADVPAAGGPRQHRPRCRPLPA